MSVVLPITIILAISALFWIFYDEQGQATMYLMGCVGVVIVIITFIIAYNIPKYKDEFQIAQDIYLCIKLGIFLICVIIFLGFFITVIFANQYGQYIMRHCLSFIGFTKWQITFILYHFNIHLYVVKQNESHFLICTR